MRFILLILAVLLTMSTVVFSKERIELAYATDSYRIFYIVEDHFTMVHFEGEMDQMSMFFLSTILEYTDSKYVSMNSPGGYLIESFTLGAYLQNNPDITFVVRNDNICMSACAFAALSANKIMIGKNGLDFHLPYMSEIDSSMTLSAISIESQMMIVGLIEYLTNAGYGHNFLGLLFEYTTIENYITFYTEEDLKFFKTEKFFDDIDITEAENKFELNTR